MQRPPPTPLDGQSTLPPVRSPRTPRSPGRRENPFAATFADLHGQEQEARRRYAAAQRRLLTMTNQHVTEMVHKRNRAAAIEVRREMDEWTGKALRRHFRDRLTSRVLGKLAVAIAGELLRAVRARRAAGQQPGGGESKGR